MSDKPDTFRSWWPVIAGVVAAAIAWGSLTMQTKTIGDNQITVAANQVAMAGKIDALVARMGEFAVVLAVTKADTDRHDRQLADISRRETDARRSP